jgi:hypothetical protein
MISESGAPELAGLGVGPNLDESSVDRHELETVAAEGHAERSEDRLGHGYEREP